MSQYGPTEQQANQNVEANLRNSLMRVSTLMTLMQEFSIEIIRHVISGGILDAQSFDEIQKRMLANLKSTNVEGPTVSEQAQFFKDCDTMLRELMSNAIARGTQPYNH